MPVYILTCLYYSLDAEAILIECNVLPCLGRYTMHWGTPVLGPALFTLQISYL